ncbi:MAG: hypothetical protein A2066_09645 [Bacteroidetes bacterium GWB2_41_8]|nr:MAG: hypothetical protein A2066_09645 [Bacteroidetes bacterium GWB2_41_8]
MKIMNLKKYISKHFILRMCLLMVLVGAAALFDAYHAGNQELSDSIRKIPAPKDVDSGKMYFYNQVNNFNLKTAAGEFSVRFRFFCTQDKFLLKHYNLRTFQLMKAESLHSFFPVVCSFHSLPFNRVIYSSPDDTPPLS